VQRPAICRALIDTLKLRAGLPAAKGHQLTARRSSPR